MSDKIIVLEGDFNLKCVCGIVICAFDIFIFFQFLNFHAFTCKNQLWYLQLSNIKKKVILKNIGELKLT